MQRAEWRRDWDAEGRALLAACADSVEGLERIGALDRAAGWVIRGHHYRYASHQLTRMSEAAAFGPRYWVGTATRKQLAEIDRVLGLLGIAWSPIERTPQPKRPEPEPQQKRDHWGSILRRVAELEQITGKSVLTESEGRDSMEGVVYRLAFLNGYLEAKLKFERMRAGDGMRDITPEPERDGGDCETPGNLICLPGVKLANVVPQDGGGGHEPAA